MSVPKVSKISYLELPGENIVRSLLLRKWRAKNTHGERATGKYWEICSVACQSFTVSHYAVTVFSPTAVGAAGSQTYGPQMTWDLSPIWSVVFYPGGRWGGGGGVQHQSTFNPTEYKDTNKIVNELQQNRAQKGTSSFYISPKSQASLCLCLSLSVCLSVSQSRASLSLCIDVATVL